MKRFAFIGMGLCMTPLYVDAANLSPVECLALDQMAKETYVRKPEEAAPTSLDAKMEAELIQRNTEARVFNAKMKEQENAIRFVYRMNDCYHYFSKVKKLVDEALEREF